MPYCYTVCFADIDVTYSTFATVIPKSFVTNAIQYVAPFTKDTFIPTPAQLLEFAIK